MKKSFIVLALVLASPLLIGCGDGGALGWGNGGWSETPADPTSSVITLAPKVMIEKSAALSKTSIRSALNLGSSQVSLVLNDSSKTTVAFSNVTDGDKYLSYSPTTTISVIDLAKNKAKENYQLDLRVLVNGVTFKAKIEVPVLLGGISSDPTKSELIATLKFAADPLGNVTYTYTIAYIELGKTFMSAPVSGTVPSGSNSLPTLYVEKVTDGTTILGAYRITGLPYNAPVFKAYFNQALDALPATYSVVFSTGETNLSFDNTTNNLAAMTLDSTKKIITVTISGSPQLKAGTDYDVTFITPDISNSGKTATTSLAAGTTYRITTKTP